MRRSLIPKAALKRALISLISAVLALPILAGETVYSPKELSEALAKFNSVSQRLAKGRASLEKGDRTGAAREFEACTAALPVHAYAHYYLANVRYMGGDFAGALTAIESAERSLNFMAALTAYAREQKSRVLEETRRLLTEETERASCRDKREAEWLARDMVGENEKLAQQAQRDAVQIKAEASRVAYFHGNILFQLRRFDEAFRQYERAIEEDARNGDAYNNAAAILFLAGHPGEADRYLQRAAAAGVEDTINLKLAQRVAQALGRPTAGILEQEFEATSDPIRVLRFSINPYEGQPGQAPLFVNTYIVYHSGSKDAVIIDPGAADPRLEACLKDKGLKPRLVLNTHGHPDHTLGNAHYARLYGIKIAAPDEDAAFYGTGTASLSNRSDLVSLSSEVNAGAVCIKVFRTPGHTPGGVCFLIGPYLFSGDSLFEDALGRMNMGGPEDDAKALRALIGRLNEILTPLSPETLVLPGHGRATTVARVLEANLILKSNRGQQ